MAKSSSDHEERHEPSREIVELSIHRMRLVWEYIAPHPALESHPVLSLIGVLSLGAYWVFGTPYADALVFILRLKAAGEAIWAWALPMPVQTILLKYPTIHLIAILLVIGVVIHIRNKGISHVILNEVVPGAGSVISVLGGTIVFALEAFAGAINENKGAIRDIVVNVISSWIFWVLVALGIVGASFSGIIDVLDSLPLP